MSKSFKTFLKHAGKDYYNQSVNPPVVRASTLIFNRRSKPPIVSTDTCIFRHELYFGVDDGAWTHDHRDHNPGLYQLSYIHHWSTLIYFTKTIPCTFSIELKNLLTGAKSYQNVAPLALKLNFTRIRWLCLKNHPHLMICLVRRVLRIAEII